MGVGALRVKFFGLLRADVGASSLLMPVKPGESVGGVLKHLAERYPPLQRRLFDRDGALQPYWIIAVNGVDIRHGGGTAAPVGPDDEVLIFPPSAGG
jgi:MoaD family protein